MLLSVRWVSTDQLPPGAAAVLAVLVQERGRVVSRTELADRAGLAALHARRVDSLIGVLRRELGSHAVVTVRGRGWMLAEHHPVQPQERT
jgi:DNA-binding response OmpR family regulator